MEGTTGHWEWRYEDSQRAKPMENRLKNMFFAKFLLWPIVLLCRCGHLPERRDQMVLPWRLSCKKHQKHPLHLISWAASCVEHALSLPVTKVPSPSRSEWTAHSASPEKRLSHNIAFVQQAAFGRIFSRSSRRFLNLPVFGSSSAFLPINRFGGHAVSSGSWIFDLTTQTRCVPLCISPALWRDHWKPQMLPGAKIQARPSKLSSVHGCSKELDWDPKNKTYQYLIVNFAISNFEPWPIMHESSTVFYFPDLALVRCPYALLMGSWRNWHFIRQPKLWRMVQACKAI